MILILGSAGDSVTQLVCARAEQRGVPWRLLDPEDRDEGQPRLGARWRAGALEAGWVAGPGWRADFADLTGVYIRFAPPPEEKAGALPPEQAQRLLAETAAALSVVVDALPCKVANRTLGGMSNHSKTFQALQIQACGLRTPATLVTNDPDAARSFAAEHGGDVIYKSLSAVRSIVRPLGQEQLDRLDLLRYGPAQFQERIRGDDVRVHVVGDRIFATCARTEAVDYRYATKEGHALAMEPTTLPTDVEAACLRLARRLDLLFVGIDLKRTPDGEHVCFEANPAPAFLFYESWTGQEISAALVDFLSQ